MKELRHDLLALLAALRHIVVGAVRIFAWDSLKDGFIDIRRLERAPRMVALVGLTLVFGLIASILFNDPLRTSGALEPLPLSSSSAHAIFTPPIAVPLALIALILAWSSMLTSALHIHPLARWGVLLCFVFFGLPPDAVGVIALAVGEDLGRLLLLGGLALLLAALLLLAFIILPRRQRPLGFEFTIILGAVGGLFVLALYGAVQASQIGNVNFVNGYLTAEAITNQRNLITPLIYLSGAEIINFGVTFTGWGAQATARYASRWMVIVLLATFLVFRWFGVLTGQILPGVPPAQLLAWGGAGLAGLCLIPLAWRRASQPVGEAPAPGWTVGLILTMVAPQQLLLVVLLIVAAFFTTQTGDPNVIANMTVVTKPIIALSARLRDAFYPLLTGAGLLMTLYGLRRRRPTLATFGVILAWTQFIYWLTENGHPLERFRYRYGDIELWFLLVLTALTLYWAARRQLVGDRPLRLLALAVFTWLLHFSDFLDNPLSLSLLRPGWRLVYGVWHPVGCADGRGTLEDQRRFAALPQSEPNPDGHWLRAVDPEHLALVHGHAQCGRAHLQ